MADGKPKGLHYPAWRRGLSYREALREMNATLGVKLTAKGLIREGFGIDEMRKLQAASADASAPLAGRVLAGFDLLDEMKDDYRGTWKQIFSFFGVEKGGKGSTIRCSHLLSTFKTKCPPLSSSAASCCSPAASPPSSSPGSSARFAGGS